MKTPALNRALVLEEKTRVADGAGGFSETWVALGTLWAGLRAGTGRETGKDFVTVSRVPYKITVRAAPHEAASRPKADQRFREGARIFTVLAVTEAGTDGRFLTCNCVEEVAS